MWTDLDCHQYSDLESAPVNFSDDFPSVRHSVDGWPPDYARRVPDLVLLRHGESTWNAENLFTGWTDVDLTPKGEDEARQAGALLAAEQRQGLDLRVVHTSVLTRAVRTANLTLEELGRSWLPVRRHWRLNERHYGALQGQEQEGDRRGVRRRAGEAVAPELRHAPAAAVPGRRAHPLHDHRYRDLPAGALPDAECLADVVARMVPYWEDAIVPDLHAFAGRAGGGPRQLASGPSSST